MYIFSSIVCDNIATMPGQTIKSKFTVSREELCKWELMKEIDKEILDLVKFFVMSNKKFFAVLSDARLIAAGKNSWYLLGLEHAHEVDKYEEMMTLHGIQVKDIASGIINVLVLTETGDVWSWGVDTIGQTGAGHEGEQDYVSPQVVMENVAEIKCGRICGAALTTASQVYTWGMNADGQLGLGNLVSQNKPMLVEALEGKNIVKIDCGGKGFVALSGEGKAFGWGKNDNYQLGLGNNENQLSPVQLNVDNKVVKSVACTLCHTHFVTEDGQLYMAGGENKVPRLFNVFGELCQQIVGIDFYDERSHRDPYPLFFMWTYSGRLFFWGESRKGRITPRETKACLTDLIKEHAKSESYILKLDVA